MPNCLKLYAVALILPLTITTVAASSEDSQKQFMRGMEALLNNQDQDAFDHFERSIVADKQSADGYIGRAVYHRKKDKLDQARRDIEEAIRLDPLRPGSWQIDGEIAFRAGRHDRAITASTKAIELADDATTAYFTRGRAYRETGRLDDALKDFGVTILRKPKLPRPRLERAKVYALLGKLGLSEADIAHADELAPFGSAVQRDISTFRKSLQQVAQAEKVVEATPPDDGGVGFGTPPDDEVNITKLHRLLDKQVAELKALSNKPEDFQVSIKRAEAINAALYVTYGKAMGLAIGPNSQSSWVAAYRSAVESASQYSKQRIQELQTSARQAPALSNPRRGAFEARAQAAAKSRAGQISSLGIPGKILDSKIVLRGLIGGMPPAPWITLREWTGLLLDADQYKVVEIRKSDDEQIWALALKKPAEPTVLIGFRYDYGDLFSHSMGQGDKIHRADSVGELQIFDLFIAGAVGFSYEDL